MLIFNPFNDFPIKKSLSFKIDSFCVCLYFTSAIRTHCFSSLCKRIAIRNNVFCSTVTITIPLRMCFSISQIFHKSSRYKFPKSFSCKIIYRHILPLSNKFSLIFYLI